MMMMMMNMIPPITDTNTNTSTNNSKAKKKNTNASNVSNISVSFDMNITVINEIEIHRNFTPHERSSSWYTDMDYLSFHLAEQRRVFCGPVPAKLETIEQSRRAADVRTMLLRTAKSIQLQGFAYNVRNQHSRNTNVSVKVNVNSKRIRDEDDEEQIIVTDYTKVLAEFCKHHTEQCSLAARMSGIENELYLARITVQEGQTQLQLKRSSHCDKPPISVTSNQSSSTVLDSHIPLMRRNERWSVVRNNNNNTYLQSSISSDYHSNQQQQQQSTSLSLSTTTTSGPNTASDVIKRSRNLRRVLCNDFELIAGGGGKATPSFATATSYDIVIGPSPATATKRARTTASASKSTIPKSIVIDDSNSKQEENQKQKEQQTKQHHYFTTNS